MNQTDSSRYLVDTGGPATMAAARVHGFTVVELMITLAVGAILLALAIPSLSGYVRSVRVVSETNDFVGALNRARSEALVRVGNVTLCASDTSVTPLACTTIGSAPFPWEDGWLLFNDCDADGVPDTATATCDIDGDGTLETNETLMRVGEALQTGDTVDGSVQSIVYLPNGAVPGSPTFDVCVDGHDVGSQIAVNTVGRINSVEVTCP